MTIATTLPPPPLLVVYSPQLQDTAAMLTADRKKRGKKLPEGLYSTDNISNFKQTAMHPVGLPRAVLSVVFLLYRVYIVLVYLVYWHLIYQWTAPVCSLHCLLIRWS